MILGMYCNWSVVKFHGEFYIPAIHQNYIEAFKERSKSLYLLSKRKNSVPGPDYVRLEGATVIELPFFSGYLSSAPYFFHIVNGLYRLLKASDFVYLRVPEPFVWMAGILNLFIRSKLHFHYVSFPLDVIDVGGGRWPFRRVKQILFYPEYLLSAFFSSMYTVSSLGERCVKRLPFSLPNLAQPVYEVSYRRGHNSARSQSELKDSKDLVRFVHVGRLVSGKGLEELLESFAIVQKKYSTYFTLSFAGDGPLRGSLENLVNSYGLANFVKFSGIVKFGKDLDDLYTSNDVLICNSLSETGPRVVHEAAFNCLYVISTDVGYVRELFCRDELCTVRLINPRSTSELVSAIRYVFDNKSSCKENAEMSQEIAKKYTLDDFVDSVLNNYYK